MKQMKVISVLWGALLISCLVVLTFLGFKLKDKNLKYRELEKKLENAAEKYVEAYSYYPQGEDNLKIMVDDLISSDIIKKEDLDKNHCSDAYVIVYLKDMVYEFDSYLKCDDYTTKNYE